MIKLLLHLVVILLGVSSVYVGSSIYGTNPVLGIILILCGVLVILGYFGLEIISEILDGLSD